MTTSRYPLPHKSHDVVDDINNLRTTFTAIDNDIRHTEKEITGILNTVTTLKNKTVHADFELENPEIQNIAANRYLVVNSEGDGFECLDGGGDPGGKTGQCSIKKSNENFDTAWGDLTEISKNGMTVQENAENGEGNQTHIFVDEIEVTGTQLPRVELTNQQSEGDFDIETNESITLRDDIEPVVDEVQVATAQNLGLVKIGDGFSIDDGELSATVYSEATNDKFGIVKIGDGLHNNEGTISRDEINPATFSNFGVVKLGSNLRINASGAMEVGDMANSGTIYNLGSVKICNYGIVELEEEILVYRVFVTDDVVVQFKLDFEPQDDYAFVLELVSDGTHLVSFNEALYPAMPLLPINRGTTRINVSKKLGAPYYDAEVSRLDAPTPVNLTPANGAINSNFLVYAPEGSNWHPKDLLRDYYDGYSECSQLRFEFETLVCVDYVKYWSRYSDTAITEFILRGSNDKENWTTLLYRKDEIIYGAIYTDRKGCFRYYDLKIGYTSGNNAPGGVTLWGTQIDNNVSEIKCLTPYMSSNEAAFAKLTASNIASGSAVNITNDNFNDYLEIKPNADGERWVKYELATPDVANVLQILIGRNSSNRQANWFKLEGSNDDENWDLLLERQYRDAEVFKNYNMLFYALNNETAYKFYKLTCIATNDSNEAWLLDGFRLFKRTQGKWNFYRGVPKLSSANQDGYEVSASSEFNSGHAGYFAFDDDVQTRWASTSNSGDAWLQVKLPTAAAFNAVQIAARGDSSLDQAPSAFQIQASNDGESWDVLHSETDISWTNLGEFQIFQFENEKAYLYYRLYITKNQGSSYKGCSCFVPGNAAYDYKRWLHKYDYIVPAMNSSEFTTKEGTYRLSSSSEHSSHKRYYLFDKDFGTRFELDGETSGWIQVELPAAKLINILGIGARNDSWCVAAPRNYTLLGSDDGAGWTTLFSISNSNTFSGSELRIHELTHTAAYKFYRLNISNPDSSVLTFARWDLVFQGLIKEY